MICTDNTGTLTRNEIRVVMYYRAIRPLKNPKEKGTDYQLLLEAAV